MKNHLFTYRAVEKKKLILSLSITIIVMIIEIIGGMMVNSIALVSDAGHMFTHAFAIIIGLTALALSGTPPCHHRTFGLYRAEVLAAFINGIFLLMVVGVIIYESLHRFLRPRDVESVQMLAIAVIGLITNLISISILHGSHDDDLNIKGVFYHMVGDALSSVGIVVGAVVIYFTDWNIIDPLVSIGISAVILIWAIGVLRESGRILLEIAPRGMDTEKIRYGINSEFSEVESIYDMHLWSISPGKSLFSAHIKLRDESSTNDRQFRLIKNIESYLKENYGIVGTTIQVVSQNEEEICEHV